VWVVYVRCKKSIYFKKYFSKTNFLSKVLDIVAGADLDFSDAQVLDLKHSDANYFD